MKRFESEARLKCGCLIIVDRSFKPVKVRPGKWRLEGRHDQHYGRPIRVKLRHHAPTLATLRQYAREGVASALDWCRVEPDGTCPHGYPSWLVALDML